MPSGVWEESEYAKLPAYDDAHAFVPGAFYCHQQNGRLCSGWVGCHDMENSIALRMAFSFGHIAEEDYIAALDYESPTPLFESGAEAAAHGRAEIEAPGPRAKRTIDKLERRRERRGQL